MSAGDIQPPIMSVLPVGSNAYLWDQLVTVTGIEIRGHGVVRYEVTYQHEGKPLAEWVSSFLVLPGNPPAEPQRVGFSPGGKP